MVEIGRPDSVPEIDVKPLYDPVPRENPVPIPVEPDFDPVEEPKAPSKKPERVPV
jgi:hypothetical protein